MTPDNHPPIPASFGRQLVLDEIFDLTLYTRIRAKSTGEAAVLLDELIRVETAHVRFWEEFFHISDVTLDVRRRFKLQVLLFVYAVIGERSLHIILESIEVYGIAKYLHLWDAYKGTPIAELAKRILDDELKHEDAIILASSGQRSISGEKIRNTFLGFNDGLVEILGAVSGFFAAFEFASSVIAAGLTVAVAGSISMAAGVFVANGSEKEVQATERRRKLFLGEALDDSERGESAFAGAIRVGLFYFIGSMVPLLPVILGTETVVASVVSSAVMIILVSFVLAFLSGMDIKKRIATNLVVIAVAVGVTSSIGYVARVWLGLNL